MNGELVRASVLALANFSHERRVRRHREFSCVS